MNPIMHILTLGLLIATLYLAWLRGYSILEIVSKRLDLKFVKTLRTHFGEPVKKI